MNTQLIIGLSAGFAAGSILIPLGFLWAINQANRKNKAGNDETIALMRERNQLDERQALAMERLANSNVLSKVGTPDATLPRLNPNPERRKMQITIEVGADFGRRLDNQWEVEREIAADRWNWTWAPEEEA